MSRASRARQPQRISPSSYATSWPTVCAVGGLLLVVACGVAVSWSSGEDQKDSVSALADASGVGGVRYRPDQRRIRELGRPTRPARDTVESLAVVADLPPRHVPKRLLASTTRVVNRDLSYLDEPKPPLREPRGDVLVSRSESELLAELGVVQSADLQHKRRMLVGGRVVEVDLDTVAKTAEKLREQIQKADPRLSRFTKPKPIDADAWLAFAAKRPDLKGLPFRKGKQCRLDRASATLLRSISLNAQAGRQAVRNARKIEPGSFAFLEAYSLPDAYEEAMQRNFFFHVAGAVEKLPDKAKMDQTVRGVVQILQAENEDVRLLLVENYLAQIDGPQATAALAQRALFDLSKKVRQAAVEALKNRSRDDYRDKLLAGFRYPWSPVADHAAQALVAVYDTAAAPDLVELLDHPDPAAPFLNRENKLAVRELVRINHLRNCMLCHAPSTDSKDLVRGVVPKYGEPLPSRAYYQSRSGVFVRADVTYLKQDFSLMHPAPNHGKWPRVQRFDYLVRQRELTAEETAELVPESGAEVERSYPQREAALYALRKLTGLDGGRSAAKWRVLLGR